MYIFNTISEECIDFNSLKYNATTGKFIIHLACLLKKHSEQRID